MEPLSATTANLFFSMYGASSILVTANEYLAIRDAQEMGQVYKFLGLSVEAGVKRDTNEKLDNDSKKDVYNADIVYTTHGALGFDYLLNNLVHSKEDRFMVATCILCDLKQVTGIDIEKYKKFDRKEFNRGYLAGRLSQYQYMAISYTLVLGYSQEEVAYVMGVDQSVISKNINSGIKRIQRELRTYLEED